ncbi:MAG: DUF4388 domain-containing protein [candidate division Zixibacteria bacterium]|nr:DUF4388 domain-containing protein [candidate division Zixibacteria bacterium]
MMELDLQGNVEQFTLPEIFQLIASSRKSGTLGIQKDESIVMIYFKDGDITYGYGPRQTFHIGSLLREKEIITSEQLAEAIKNQAEAENSKRLGEILINNKTIDRSDLENVIRNQIEELLYSLLSWSSGTFKFYENQFPTEEEITVNISVENVILEGLRRADEQNMVKETLPNTKMVYTITASQAGRHRDVNMKADEWNIMALVNGHRTLEEICKLSHLDHNKTLVKLAQLKLAGIITQCEKPKEQKGELDQMVNRLAGLFEDYLTDSSESTIKSRNITSSFLETVD